MCSTHSIVFLDYQGECASLPNWMISSTAGGEICEPTSSVARSNGYSCFSDPPSPSPERYVGLDVPCRVANTYTSEENS